MEQPQLAPVAAPLLPQLGRDEQLKISTMASLPPAVLFLKKYSFRFREKTWFVFGVDRLRFVVKNKLRVW